MVYETQLIDLSLIIAVDVSPHIWSWVWTCTALVPGICALASWCNGSTPDWQFGGVGSSPSQCIKLFREV